MREPIASWARTHPDVFGDGVRIYLGLGLMAKAARFTETKSHLVSMIAQAGGSESQQSWMAYAVIGTHLAGGFLLAVGLWTRVAALVQVPILAGAVVFVELRKFAAPELRGNFDLAVLVLFLLVMIAVFGPGRLSVDAWRERKAAQTASKAGAATHA